MHSNFLELARNKQVTARYSSEALAEVPFFTGEGCACARACACACACCTSGGMYGWDLAE